MYHERNNTEHIAVSRFTSNDYILRLTYTLFQGNKINVYSLNLTNLPQT